MSEGKRILITGAASGIGRATAQRFAGDGARVALLDVNGEQLRTTVAALNVSQDDILELQADVGDEDEVKAAFDAASEKWGGLDVVVAGAGIELERKGDNRVDLLELEVWDRIIRTNLTGMFLTCKYATKALLNVGGGSMIVIGSPTGLYGFAAGEHAYSSSKAGCHGLARAMANELAPLGIRVNVVVPGFIDTPLNAELLADPASRADAESAIPMGRPGAPSEVAAMIAWLASDEASYSAGAYFFVDGGQTCI